MVRAAVAGIAGRMGSRIAQLVRETEGIDLVAGFERPDHPCVGRDIGEVIGAGRLEKPVAARIQDVLQEVDVVIDFTAAIASLQHAAEASSAGKAMVIGTTGFSDAQRARLAEAARSIALVVAPNMAVGVNATFKLAETAAKILGDDYDVEIVEAHHRHKVDAPSGTALKLGEVVARALGRDLAACAVYGRHGDTGERDAKAIGFHAIRGGDIVGEHTVIFAGAGERVEVTVRSSSRMTYALGALRAAKFLRGRKPGLYDMSDVLGLR